MTKPALRLCFAAIPLLASLLSASDARACGGCFHPENQPPENAGVVLAHRMALSISPDQSVLWDQVQYAGEPAEFAWVLPVKPGARLEVGSDAWFETLDAATSSRIVPPTIQCVTTTLQEVPASYGYRPYGCSGAAMTTGCAADGEMLAAPETREVTEVTDLVPQQDPVSIVHQGSAGPYETVTLHSDVPGALPGWLQEHGYAIDADIQPVIDAYAADGFDFIALRLLPDQGVQQMKPVRVIQPGAVTTLPLRMVASGAGPTVALTLFVIAEGRYEAKNFPMGTAPDGLTWDFNTGSSDWSTRIAYAYATQPTAWIPTFAQVGALFAPNQDPADGTTIAYQTSIGQAFTLADAFMDQALGNGESAISCAGIFDQLSTSLSHVVDTCPAEGGECADAPPGDLDARYFECGPIKDLARALTGQHPADVWVTRLEAQLPRTALSADLELTPAEYGQYELSNVHHAASFVNPPCEVTSTTALRDAGGAGRRAAGYSPLAAAGLLALAAAAARRARKPARRRG